MMLCTKQCVIVDAEALARLQTDPDAKPIRVVPDVHALRVQLGFAVPTVMTVTPVRPSSPPASAATAAAAPAPAPAPGGSGVNVKATGGAGPSTTKPARSGKFGTGGMATKLVAAQLATAAGVTTVICRSAEVERLEAIMSVCVCVPRPLRATPLRVDPVPSCVAIAIAAVVVAAAGCCARSRVPLSLLDPCALGCVCFAVSSFVTMHRVPDCKPDLSCSSDTAVQCLGAPC